MKKYIIPSILASLFFVFSGCQDILECVINRKPILSNEQLSNGQLSKYYFERIPAEIKNEPYDDSYYYYFSVHGEIPDGIDVIFDYRDVIIEGTPLERGRYGFTINLNVEQADDYYENCENRLNDCDGLCEESVSRRYTLVIR